MDILSAQLDHDGLRNLSIVSWLAKKCALDLCFPYLSEKAEDARIWDRVKKPTVEIE